MPNYKTLVTTVGRAKIAAALASGSTVNLSEMVLGDGNGNAVEPNENQTALVRQVYKGQLNSVTRDPKNPNYVIAEMVVPTTIGGWAVREVGLYDNSGALVVVGNFPDTYKPQLSEGSARDLVVRVVMEVSNGELVALQIDPSVVLASRQWVLDNFALAALLPGGTTGQVLRKKTNSDGDVEWYDPASGLNILVDVIEENQTLTSNQKTINLAIATTESLAIYIDGLRLRSDQWKAKGRTQVVLTKSYGEGAKLTMVQNEPAGAPDFLRSANNLADLHDVKAARENLGISTTKEIAREIVEILYPVGEILITHRSGNPQSWLGIGTWERYGKGRTLVGFDSEDSSFNELDKVGGTKTHQLIVQELPAHQHVVDPPATNTSRIGDHNHNNGVYDRILHWIGRDTVSYVNDDDPIQCEPALTSSRVLLPAGAHDHTVDIPQFNSGVTGQGHPHNNMQPYIVVNFWKRIF